MKFVALAAIFTALATAARAEEIVFFEASKAGYQAWSWNSARVSDKTEGMVITESSPTNTAGDAYVSTQFPYIPSGHVVFEVADVAKGDYTLQVLGFRKGTHFMTVTVINHATSPGRHDFHLRTLNMPDDTETILFKVWVAGADAASVVVKELRYANEIDADKVVLDDRFQDAQVWRVDTNQVVFAIAAGKPGKVTVNEGAAFGSVAYDAAFSRDQQEEILLQIPETDKGCVATLQLDVLDEGGAFISAVDVITDVAVGHHVARLDAIKWPEGASSFAPKIWVNGKPGSGVSFDRLLIYKQ
ncbi:MAG TPA: hypothetical protein VIH35_10125 [Kiritimatiellia bacterium]|jgi:hypothetical protein